MTGIYDGDRENNLLVFEVCAQAHRAMLEGRPAGSWGAVRDFSFYLGKNLGTLGESWLCYY